MFALRTEPAGVRSPEPPPCSLSLGPDEERPALMTVIMSVKHPVRILHATESRVDPATSGRGCPIVAVHGDKLSF
jgi:hypothetical protein